MGQGFAFITLNLQSMILRASPGSLFLLLFLWSMFVFFMKHLYSCYFWVSVYGRD